VVEFDIFFKVTDIYIRHIQENLRTKYLNLNGQILDKTAQKNLLP